MLENSVLVCGHCPFGCSMAWSHLSQLLLLNHSFCHIIYGFVSQTETQALAVTLSLQLSLKLSPGSPFPRRMSCCVARLFRVFASTVRTRLTRISNDASPFLEVLTTCAYIPHCYNARSHFRIFDGTTQKLAKPCVSIVQDHQIEWGLLFHCD